MKLLVKISPNLTIQAEGENTKDIFKQIALIQETFEDSECGLCGNPELQYVVREADENEFYELRCKKCYAKLTFGQKKDGKKMYPRRYKIDNKGKAVKENEKAVRLGQKGNGWVKWNPATQTEE